MKPFEKRFSIARSLMVGLDQREVEDLIREEMLKVLDEIDEPVESFRLVHDGVWSIDYMYFVIKGYVRETRFPRGFCQNCGDEIRIAIFKGGDWCCDDCRKALQERD